MARFDLTDFEWSVIEPLLPMSSEAVMTAPLSQDLRRRLVRAVDEGSSVREAAARFKVSALARSSWCGEFARRAAPSRRGYRMLEFASPVCSRNARKPQAEGLGAFVILLVAGTGFEPVTFRL